MYIPRSIQRIHDTDMQAFVKRVDAEISESAVRDALLKDGFHVTSLLRISNREKNVPGSTMKITFSDMINRDNFIEQGLKVCYLCFPAEKVLHKLTSVRVHIVFGFCFEFSVDFESKNPKQIHSNSKNPR